MKYLLLPAMLLAVASCKKNTLPPVQSACIAPMPDSVTSTHPKKQRIQHLLDSLTAKGVPGISLAVHQPGKGWFTGSSGYSDIQARKRFEPCQVSRAGSVVKILTAVSVLQLVEKGKVNLDKPIADYLPATVLQDIENAGQATIRQLLNHSGGLYNYIQDPQFQLASLNDLTRTWQPGELLAYARNRSAYFNPGEGLKYSNTSYILLGMLIEKVSGIHFSVYFKQHIIQPLHLEHTRFDISNPVPADLARGYVDYYNTGNIIESTYYNGWDYYTADGGLHSVPFNLCLLMRSLFQGKLINQTSLQEMLTTIPLQQEEDFFPMEYGLGIFKVHTPYGPAWFHSGDAIGYFATVCYFPGDGTTFSWMTNGNYGTIDPLINSKEAYENILGSVFK